MSQAEAGPRKRATIKDVAEAAGVSPGTVSNALSGKRKVDALTRARIEQAITALNYVPNLAARGMRTGRAGTIAIFSSMPTGVAAGSSRLGFLMEIAASAAVTALESNVALLLVPPIEDPSAALGTIAFDGAILVEPAASDPYLPLLQSRDVPTVVVGPTSEMQTSAIELDYEQMATLLFEHLVDVGARRFPLVIGQSARASNMVFRDTYLSLCDKRGMTPEVISLPEANAEEGARAATIDRIATGNAPDGVLVPIDAMASGVMAALREAGLTVPQNVKVATRYDGLRARSETPQLTALDLQLDKIAELATRSLVALLDDPDTGKITMAPKPRLMVRGSTVHSA